MVDLVESFGERVVPVVVLAQADRAESLAEALVAGGLHVAEVTFRTAAAAEAIRRMAEHRELVVGAGNPRDRSNERHASKAISILESHLELPAPAWLNARTEPSSTLTVFSLLPRCQGL